MILHLHPSLGLLGLGILRMKLSNSVEKHGKQKVEDKVDLRDLEQSQSPLPTEGSLEADGCHTSILEKRLQEVMRRPQQVEFPPLLGIFHLAPRINKMFSLDLTFYMVCMTESSLNPTQNLQVHLVTLSCSKR